MTRPTIAGVVIQEGTAFYADEHETPETASSYLIGRRAACRVILARDYERDRDYINFEFGWWSTGENTFRRVRYMPARWAEEFVIALRKAQAHLADHEDEVRTELGATLEQRMGPRDVVRR